MLINIKIYLKTKYKIQNTKKTQTKKSGKHTKLKRTQHKQKQQTYTWKQTPTPITHTIQNKQNTTIIHTKQTTTHTPNTTT